MQCASQIIQLMQDLIPSFFGLLLEFCHCLYFWSLAFVVQCVVASCRGLLIRSSTISWGLQGFHRSKVKTCVCYQQKPMFVHVCN